MTKSEAKKWSIKKWEWIVAHDGCKDGLVIAIPELLEFESGCAYCEKYSKSAKMKYYKNGYRTYCYTCPLFDRKELRDCSDVGSVFHVWYCYRNKETAQAVLDAIRRS